MRKMRWLALLLACALLIGDMPFAVGAAREFEDVSGHWAEAAIREWSGYGVINGYAGKFRPDDPVTRAEIAVMLNNVFRYKDVAPNIFWDLEDGVWYTEPILKAFAEEIMVGGDGLVRPGDNVTREEAFCLMARAMGLTTGSDAPLEFSDAAQVSGWAKKTVSGMVVAGFVHGNDGKLRPKDTLTRAEAVTILDQMIALVACEDTTYSGEVRGAVVVNSPCTLRGLNVIGRIIISPSVSTDKVKFYSTKASLGITYRVPREDGGYRKRFAYAEADSLVKDGMIIFGDRRLSIKTDVPKNVLMDAYFRTDDKGVISYTQKGAYTAQGIDVSSWQGEIDWKKVAADGITFAIIRAGYRGYEAGTVNEDRYFKKNIQGALAAGLKVGVYFFSQAINEAEAVAEAKFCLGLVKDYKITYPIVFDWEDVSDTDARTYKMPNATLTACAAAFCKTVEDAGYVPSVYFGASKGYLNLDLSKLKEYDFWFARYKSNVPKFYYRFSIWQYSSTGRVNGINGSVDRDISFKKY